MSRVVLKRLVVRREFKPGVEPDSLEVRRDCGMGCKCGSVIYRPRLPLNEQAESPTLCFNGRTRQGISEVSGTAHRVASDPGTTAFEVDAELVEVR